MKKEISILLLLLLVGCSLSNDATGVKVSPSIPKSPIIMTEIFSQTTATPPPATLMMSPTAKITLTTNLTPNVNFKANKIADLDEIGDIFWAEDGQGVYYQMVESEGEDNPEEIDWYFFDLATEENQKLESPPDKTRKARNISPSGRYILEEEKVEPHVYTIWFVDTVENERVQLLDSACGLSYSTQWADDERIAYFSEACTHGPIYVLNTTTRTATLLSEISSHHSEYTPSEPSLSPDGKKLAISSDSEGYLQIIFLEDGSSVKQPHIFFQDRIWSADSNKLFYWTGPSFGNSKTELHTYDLRSGNDLVILTMDQVFNIIDAAQCDGYSTSFSPNRDGFLLRCSENEYPYIYPLWVVKW